MPTVSFIPIPQVSPASISGLNFWIDATDPAGTGIQPADGTTLTSWQDKSSTGYTLTSGGAQFLKTGLNSKPTINIGQGYFANSQGSNNWEEVWVVAVWNGGADFAGNYRGLFTGFYDGAADGVGFEGDAGSGFFAYGNSFIQNPRNLNGTSTDTLFPTIRSPFVIHGSAGRLVSCRGVCVGNDRNNGGRVWIGYMSEAFCFNRELTTSERLLMEGYCAWKWGIQASFPTNHPYYGSSPILAPGQKAQKLVTIPAFTGTLFNPLSVTGCQLWLDAADSTSLVKSGSSVTQWNDKSGNNLNFTTNVGTPTYISDATSSVVNFPPAGAVMTTSNSINITTTTTFFTVSKLTAGYTGIEMGVSFNNILGSDLSIRYYQGVLNYFNGTAGNNDLFTNNSTGFYINGSSLTAPASFNNYNVLYGAANNSGSTTLSLSSSFLSRYFIGNHAEILVFSNILTTTQRQQIEGYLAWKWGIQSYLPGNHLYYVASPNTLTPKKAQPIVSIRGPFWAISIPNGTLGTDYTVTTDGNYRYYNFLTTGTTFSFILLGSPAKANYIAVAGGGGGGQAGGGGGAGGVVLVSSLITLAPNNYSITVGGGGTNGLDGGNGNYGGNGSNTIFALGASNLANAVGGGGGGGGGGASQQGQNGGSGGGGPPSSYTQNTIPGLGTAGQGKNGGTGAYSNYNSAAAGGGGYSSVGVDGLISTNAQTTVITTYGGNGGVGLTWNNGSVLYLAGGGGGGVAPYFGYSLAVLGSNGYGGGTGGNFYSNAGTNGTPNTGGGGGGGGNFAAATKPGNGGSGIFSIGLLI